MSNGVLPISLALSEDLAFEAVLADIPLFCVGLMAMGLVTFIFVMKRVNPVALYLCIASLLLFVAAILDLGQLLIRGPVKVSRNLDLNAVSGFIIAREIGLALSDGFLLLFLWKAVAQCPASERRRSVRQLSGNLDRSRAHSASWTRWGVAGMILKWFTLALAIVIPLLQIVWRIIGDQRRYGSFYIAESTLEIVASAIFILKVLLNVFLSPSPSWWIPFKSYLGMLLALAISTAIGVGNLVVFSFSETVLGRFLRAISIYVLLLYNLISIFHKPSIARIRVDDNEAAQATSRQEKPKGLTIKTADLQPPPSPRSPSIMVVDRTVPTPVERRRPPTRTSTSSRLSMWVNRTISPVLEQYENPGQVIRTISSRSSRKSPVVLTPAKRPKKPELHFDIITPVLPSQAVQVDSPEDPPTTGISLTYYTMNTSTEPSNSIADGDPSADRMAATINRPQNTINPSSVSQVSLIAQPPSRPTSSLSSFDELMRQQNELDKSIANLKFLSLDAAVPQPQATIAEYPSLALETPASIKSRPQSTLKSGSQSPRSEFSLSVFPEPPPRPESVVAESPSRYTSIRPFVLRRKVARPSLSDSIRIPFTSSIPGSPSQNGINEGLASTGTQYDVTSFIGDLTEPGNHNTATATPATLPSSGLRSAPILESSLGMRFGDPPDTAASHSPIPNLRPMYLPSVASERRVIPPITLPAFSRTETQISPSVRHRDSSTPLKPFLLGTAGSPVPVSLPSSTMVPLGPRRASRTARLATQKTQISVPMFSASNTLADAPEAYERPRAPPPLLGQVDGTRS